MRDLPWLQSATEDFNACCAALADSDDLPAAVQLLTATALTVNQSNRLVRALSKIDDADALLGGVLTPFKLGLVSNGTAELLVPGLVTAALRRGIHLQVVQAEFGQVAQQALDSESTLNRAQPDAVLIALDYRGYPFAANAWASLDEGLQAAADGLGFLDQVRQGFATHCGAVCIVQSLAPPPYPLLGGLDAQLDNMLRRGLAEFNIGLADSVRNSADVLLDVAALAASVGLHDWFDERQWYMSRVPMANQFAPLYCDHVARILAALRGKSKKCLVLDLDNTLWGGVIGDDGMDGIHIGPGDPRGESYLAIQRYALELKRYGVILAVCSKNELATALQPFHEHPEMLLKEDDFAAFVANWDDKASNVQAIATTLNIGLDALVFVDDNPFEREVVRSLVPEVAVPELPSDAALIPRTIAAAGYFEMVDFTREDVDRNAQYAANAKRSKLLQSVGDISDFLASLDMTIHFAAFDEIGRKRITQLINKTNQFNLTTRRYTEADVREFESANDVYTMQVRLVDRFGDNGMISVIICRQSEDQPRWDIDTWLMSCRVIKRGVEQAVCDELVAAAQANGIETLRGVYRSTAKNQLVRDHYQSLGFELLQSSAEETVWQIDTVNYRPRQPPMKVERAGQRGSLEP